MNRVLIHVDGNRTKLKMTVMRGSTTPHHKTAPVLVFKDKYQAQVFLRKWLATQDDPKDDKLDWYTMLIEDYERLLACPPTERAELTNYIQYSPKSNLVSEEMVRSEAYN